MSSKTQEPVRYIRADLVESQRQALVDKLIELQNTVAMIGDPKRIMGLLTSLAGEVAKIGTQNHEQ